MSHELDYQKNVCSDFFQVAPGVWGMKDYFVNFYMVLNPYDGTWVLIDTGLKTSAKKIKKMASQLFGAHSRPSAIVVTHGHFDHIGSLTSLVEEWKVPVYAHYLEVPYLTGKSDYPPADPTVGGGLMSALSFLYPTTPINIWNRINILPEDNGIPGLPEWRYIHTPGHSPGHISLYRESDQVLLAGDALTTTRIESMISTIFQTKKVGGPPKFLTYDWALARQSVKTLVKLEPEIVATGHGMPMKGKEVRRELHYLSDHFYDVAVPTNGRYVPEPAVADATGFIYVPARPSLNALLLKAISATAVFSFALLLLYKKNKSRKIQNELLAYESW